MECTFCSNLLREFEYWESYLVCDVCGYTKWNINKIRKEFKDVGSDV